MASVLCLGSYDCTLLYLVSSGTKSSRPERIARLLMAQMAGRLLWVQGKTLCLVRASSPRCFYYSWVENPLLSCWDWHGFDAVAKIAELPDHFIGATLP